MTDTDTILEVAQLIILLMQRIDTIEDMMVDFDTRLEQLEKVIE